MGLLVGAEVCGSRRSVSPSAGGCKKVWLPSTELAKLPKLPRTWYHVLSKVSSPFGNAMFSAFRFVVSDCTVFLLLDLRCHFLFFSLLVV